jgi:HEAT repeat protein
MYSSAVFVARPADEFDGLPAWVRAVRAAGAAQVLWWCDYLRMDSRFAGLEAIAWAEMEHAYGTAEAVPAIMRGLVDPDPAVREQALDHFYGAVHHQGDVYECTVACVPFLIEAVTDVSVPDRHELLRLLASVCGADEGSVRQWDAADPDPYGMHANINAARDILAAHWNQLAELVADPVAAVRKEAALVLAACVSQWPLTFGLLKQRVSREADPSVRCAHIAATGVAGQNSTLRDEVISWLTELSISDSVAVVRLQALATRISLDPDSAGDEFAETLMDAVTDCFRSDTRPLAPSPGEMGSPATLVAVVRHIDAQRNAEYRLPEVSHLAGRIVAALGDRVGLRTQIVTRLLDIGEWGMQSACCCWAQELGQHWRYDSFRPMVEAVARLLPHPELRVRKAAANTLLNLGPLALPAADSLVIVMTAGDTADPGNPFDVSAADSALQTLAELCDPRALPVILNLLRQSDPPVLAGLLEGVQPMLLPHLPFLRKRMLKFARSTEYGQQASSVAAAIGRFGPAAAAAAGDLAVTLTGSANTIVVLQALRTIGPTATPALPAVENLLQHKDPEISAAAAETWWCLTGDPQPALTAAQTLLTGDQYQCRNGAELASALGAQAEKLVPQLTQMLAVDDTSGWTPACAAIALWRITGQAQPAVQVLLEAAACNPITLDVAVPCWAEIGPDARDALPLLHRELASSARHHGRGLSVSPVSDDMRYLAGCREAVARIQGQ